MHFSQNFLSGKRKYVSALLLLLFVFVLCAAFSSTDSDDFDTARREVLLRRIGHEILLQSGDSTSRVLPIKMIAENEYQIGFENELTFQTDSLVDVTQRLLARDLFARDYVVTVINCGNSSVAYGYAISKSKKDDIVACKGRRQPKACYKINIKFKPNGLSIVGNNYFLGSLSLIAFVGFAFMKLNKPKSPSHKDESNSIFTLGTLLFDAQQRQLIFNENVTELTKTETRLLVIFASSPNATIDRSRLQKEIWEDEGVIVGRSLDMFISKLRKKLELDPNIKIVVVRSRGYKLEIGS